MQKHGFFDVFSKQKVQKSGPYFSTKANICRFDISWKVLIAGIAG